MTQIELYPNRYVLMATPEMAIQKRVGLVAT
jgi:hypothetical protein